jgi:hypothetical protein
MYLIRILLISILFINKIGEEPKDKSIFVSPVKIPLSLSANFGELRIDHFHSGLDIRTQGVTGKEVVAAASGYVYRISVSPGGFGKALYLHHPSGYSTVYGHLDSFTPEIEEYVVSRQYEDKSYMITLWPPKDRFRFNQGDIIAYSGNSGSSSGPHLHYEVRKSDEEIPVNPLLFEFGIEDDYRPVIEKLVIYPLGGKATVNNQNKPLKFNVSGSNGNYFLSSKNEVTIDGPAGFGLITYDILNNSFTKCSVYSIELKIDSLPVFNYLMDAFSFNESRYINSHIDYETYLKENIYVERAFVLPNDKLSVYHDVVNKGVYNFNDEKKHRVEIIVTDTYNNRSVLSFLIKSAGTPKSRLSDKPDENNIVIMPYNRNNKFVSKNVTVIIPAGVLYDTLRFEFSQTSANPNMYSDIYMIHNKYTPVHKAYSLSIKPGRIPAAKESKLLIVQVADELKRNPLATTWVNGYLNANPNSFGTFYVGIDTVPPVISVNGLTQGENLAGKTELRIKISDDFSGIKSYEPQIDGKWALFEYDQKNNLLIHRFDSKRIAKGIKHSLSLTVADNCGNLSALNREFIW